MDIKNSKICQLRQHRQGYSERKLELLNCVVDGYDTLKIIYR